MMCMAEHYLCNVEPLRSMILLCVMIFAVDPIVHESGLTFDCGVCTDNHRCRPFVAKNVIQKMLISSANRNRFVKMNIGLDENTET